MKIRFLYIYLQAVNWLSKQILENFKSKDLIWIYFEECFDATVIEEDENSVEINGSRENKDYLGAEYQGITSNKGSLLFHLRNSISRIQIKVIFDFIHSFFIWIVRISTLNVKNDNFFWIQIVILPQVSVMFSALQCCVLSSSSFSTLLYIFRSNSTFRQSI